jgi:hypothetical protein
MRRNQKIEVPGTKNVGYIDANFPPWVQKVHPFVQSGKAVARFSGLCNEPFQAGKKHPLGVCRYARYLYFINSGIMD